MNNQHHIIRPLTTHSRSGSNTTFFYHHSWKPAWNTTIGLYLNYQSIIKNTIFHYKHHLNGYYTSTLCLIIISQLITSEPLYLNWSQLQKPLIWVTIPLYNNPGCDCKIKYFTINKIIKHNHFAGFTMKPPYQFWDRQTWSAQVDQFIINPLISLLDLFASRICPLWRLTKKIRWYRHHQKKRIRLGHSGNR